MGLAGEALVASRWLDGFAADLLRLKRLQQQLNQTLDGLRDFFPVTSINERTSGQLIELRIELPVANGLWRNAWWIWNCLTGDS